MSSTNAKGSPLQDIHIVLGVTGSIACYKAADLASKLTQAGAQVDVILTEEASHFVAPLTFRSLTHRPVVSDLFDPTSELSVEHVALAQRASAVVIAPATANTIAKVANGLADDVLTCTVLATKAPVVLAPAMNSNMYDNAITQSNIQRLKDRGFAFVGPAYGRLAEGIMGLGRMAETEEVLGHIRWVLGRRGDLAGRHLVVSAGGTQEPLDPVRVLTNRSSGKMGYALAEAARDRGAQVILVAGPNALPDPIGIKIVKVETALQMRDAVLAAVKDAHALIMAAAVADYRPARAVERKIKKEHVEDLSIPLVRNPDILSEATGNFIKVGFAAESEDLLENAKHKLLHKGAHLIVANDITATDSGFSVDTNRVVILDRDGKTESLPLMSKYEVAHRILDRILVLMGKST